MTALLDAGLGKSFDLLVGTSAGAPTVVYFASGEPAKGTSIFYEELAEQDFINFGRGLKGGEIAKLDYLSSVFRGTNKLGKNKALNKEAVLKHPSEIYVQASKKSALGKKVPKLLNLKDGSECADLVTCIDASIAMPFIAKRKIHINGEYVFDGAIASVLPPMSFFTSAI